MVCVDLFSIIISFLSFFSYDQTCIATTFGSPGDIHAGGDAMCIGRKIDPKDIGVAHRTLPCGSMVIVRIPRTGKMMLATIVDRGPYGAMYEGQWLIKRKQEDPGEWRGCLDMTPRLSTLLDHNGFEKVQYVSVPWKKCMHVKKTIFSQIISNYKNNILKLKNEIETKLKIQYYNNNLCRYTPPVF